MLERGRLAMLVEVFDALDDAQPTTGRTDSLSDITILAMGSSNPSFSRWPTNRPHSRSV
jgi:hypothetical protein